MAVTGALTTALVGCSVSRTFAPQTYTVQRGDTLSEIAQRYDVDWHNLAQWNHIRAPYRLALGQRLTLDPYPPLNYAEMSGPNHGSGAAAGGRPGAESNSSSGGTTHPLPPRRQPTVSRSPVTTSAQPAGPSNPPPTAPGNAKPAAEQSPPVANAEESSIESASTSRAARQTTVKAGGPSADGWQWPASGSLLRAYDSSARRRGIELGGKVGAPVYAASSGTVVYNGTGLKGYGKLIIIKHDEHYLSAYGFNRKSLVEQGQTVAAGAHIADMGLGPGNKPMLHFEIRHDGDPIDPQEVLPKR